MNTDPTSSQRKQDHIDLAFQSQIGCESIDQRFYYEPMLASHPKGDPPPIQFLGQEMKYPIWVSSMTGGTEKAKKINENLAKACNEFGLGMGLGSCRPLLESNDRLSDFNFRHLIGSQPFYANLGVAQIEELIDSNNLNKISELVKTLEADGLIIHVNPLQEWLQTEGDRFKYSPLETIKMVLESTQSPVIVKEVGQGIGRNSLKALLRLPLAAIEFAAHGGTNFSKLELLRNKNPNFQLLEPLAFVGHSAGEMVDMVNALVSELGSKVLCNQLIISGGVKHFLDGYYYISKSTMPAVYGQASKFLAHAQGDYEDLYKFINTQVEGLKLSMAYLRVK